MSSLGIGGDLLETQVPPLFPLLWSGVSGHGGW